MQHLVSLRLASILMQTNADEAQQALKKLRRSKNKEGKATLHEVQQLDKQCITAFGEGLGRFVPSYFTGGVQKMTPGCFSSGLLKLERLWSDAPLLRVVSDRDSTMSNVQTFLISRLRALEVSDPCHILWRCAQLAIEHAGFKSSVATLTVAMNAWKGFLGRACRLIDR